MKQPKLTMTSWDGDFPLPGDYCMTRSGRTAYLVLEVRRGAAGKNHKFIVERRPRESLRPDDAVHWFKWNKRS